ncbi:MAG: diguanylate cyclase [Roseburia inulinivorans]|nr:diguanylate cyclase [Roseburia inulinivorans]
MNLQKKETLLIVDDSKFQRAIIKEMLGEHFRLEEATSGEECLMILEKSSHLIDLVLLDLVMPGIDGFEVLRRRQTMDAFKDIPVIVLTSSNSIEFQIDEMTSLFNKMTIENLVSETLTNAPSALHALMVIDIDNFKSANDIYGHTVGDHIICVIAGVISSQFRNTDFVGRIGGDEFVVLMPDIPAKEVAFEKAESLIQIILKKEGLSIPDNISISIGLAFSDSEDKTYASFFGKADQALYVSKKSGKFIWDTVKDANPNHVCPVIAICREGSLDQIQTAVSSEIIDDLLFSPLEVSVLKRRIKASIHPDKNNEAYA